MKMKEYREEKKLLLEKYQKIAETSLVPIGDINKNAIDEYRLSLEKEQFTVSFCGQIKAGKSTLINALIFGEDVLPRADLPHTAKITILKYAEKPSFKVEFYNKQEWGKLTKGERDYYENYLKESVEKSLEKSGIYIDEVIKENNYTVTEKNDLKTLEKYVSAEGEMTPFVKEVTVYYPADILKEIDIVDTPGTNDPNKLRSKITKDWIHKSNAVVYVVYAMKAFDVNDMDFIDQYLLHVPSNIRIMAVNKVDNAQDLEDLKDWVNALKRDEEIKTRGLLKSNSTVIYISALGGLISAMARKKIPIPENFNFYKNQLEKTGFLEPDKHNLKELIDQINDKLIRTKGERILESHKKIISSIFDKNLRKLERETENLKEHRDNYALKKEEVTKKRKDVEDLRNKLDAKQAEFEASLNSLQPEIDEELDKGMADVKRKMVDGVDRRLKKFDYIDKFKTDTKWAIKDALEEHMREITDIGKHLSEKITKVLDEQTEAIATDLNKTIAVRPRRMYLLVKDDLDSITRSTNKVIEAELTSDILTDIIREMTYFWQRWFNTEKGRDRVRSGTMNQFRELLEGLWKKIIFQIKGRFRESCRDALKDLNQSLQEDLRDLQEDLREIEKKDENFGDKIKKLNENIALLEERRTEIDKMKGEIL